MSFGNLWMNNSYSNYNSSTSGSWLNDGNFDNVLKSGTGFNNVNINIFGNRFCEPSVGSSLGFMAGGLSSMLIGGLLGGLFSGGNNRGQQIQQTYQNQDLVTDYFTSRFAAIDAQSIPTGSSVTTAGTSTVAGTSGAQNTTNNNSNVSSKGTANIPGDIQIGGDITGLTMDKATDTFPKSFTIKDSMKDTNGGQDEFTFHYKSTDSSGVATYTVDVSKDIKNNNKDFTINKDNSTYQFTIKTGAITKGADGKYKIDMKAIASQAAIMKKAQS